MPMWLVMYWVGRRNRNRTGKTIEVACAIESYVYSWNLHSISLLCHLCTRWRNESCYVQRACTRFATLFQSVGDYAACLHYLHSTVPLDCIPNLRSTGTVVTPAYACYAISLRSISSVVRNFSISSIKTNYEITNAFGGWCRKYNIFIYVVGFQYVLEMSLLHPLSTIPVIQIA